MRPHTRDDRAQRDRHALTAEGMVLCNPRDKEAARRARAGDIATAENAAAVTCQKCRALLFARARARQEEP